MQGMWTKFGYDPVQDPNSRFLQCMRVQFTFKALQACTQKVWTALQNNTDFLNVDFPSGRVTDNSNSLSEIKNRKGKGCTISFFNVPITPQFSLSIIDFTDPRILEFIGTIKRMDRVGKFGWYSSDSINRIRRYISKFIESQIDEFQRNPQRDSFNYHKEGLTELENYAEYYRQYVSLPDIVESAAADEIGRGRSMARYRIPRQRAAPRPKPKGNSSRSRSMIRSESSNGVQSNTKSSNKSGVNIQSGLLDDVEGFDVFDEDESFGSEEETDDDNDDFEAKESGSDDDNDDEIMRGGYASNEYKEDDEEGTERYKKRDKRGPIGSSDSDSSDKDMDVNQDEFDKVQHQHQPQHQNVLGIGGNLNDDTIQIDINLDNI